MSIKIKNFGPISEAEVEIRPLTIIVGKNNLGKSYLAQLLHAYLITRLQFLRPYWHYGSTYDYSDLPSYLIFSNLNIEEVKNTLSECRSNSYSLKETVNEVVINIVHQIERRINLLFKNAIEQIFSLPIGELVNANARRSIINFKMYDNLTVRLMLKKDNSINIKTNINKKSITMQVSKFIEENNIKLNDLRKTKEIEMLMNKIFSYAIPISNGILEKTQNSLYIPAGRSGLLESYEVIQAAYNQLGTASSISRGINIPPLSGTSSQFYNIYLKMSTRPGPYQFTTFDFQNIMSGDVLFIQDPYQNGFRKIVYRHKIGSKIHQIDLRHSASMIKELAPIYFIIKNLAKKESTIIIEEPESHLHPGAQAKLLEIFIKVVKEKLNLIITTHSDILLRKLSNCIGLYKINKINSAFIDPSLIHIYLIKENSDLNIVLENVEISEYEIESLPTFDDILKELYEEEIEISEKIQVKG